ncbi:hypothetical protein I79_020241 [Cricetulus griseus]|uniref:Uncharacterized protein n=1 Tax=Cricetulus griseus TaxID=10029 RepID=G3I9J4_CRIGR|nr:hypothetical protein I79_020241 [Cricetulus griseus]
MTKSNLGRKGFILPYNSQSTMKGSQGRNSRQEPEGKYWDRGHGGVPFTGLFSMACSACFLIQCKTTCLQVAPPIVDTAIINEGMSHMLAHRLIIFFGRGFQDKVSLYCFGACSGTRSVHQAGLELTEIHLPLPQCWDQRSVPLMPGSHRSILMEAFSQFKFLLPR